MTKQLKLIANSMLGTIKVWLYIDLNKYDEAIMAYDKAIEIDPKNSYGLV
jgi:tetratricopeptide (TPR) repeat protein